jgi:hypothetical protein
MLERRRKNKHYDIVPGDDEDGEVPGDGERDVELGEGIGVSAGAERNVSEQETGIVDAAPAPGSTAPAAAASKPNVTEELDNWDENEEDGWDDEQVGQETPASSEAGGDTKKRTD